MEGAEIKHGRENPQQEVSLGIQRSLYRHVLFIQLIVIQEVVLLAHK